MCLLKALLKTGRFDECNLMHGIGRTNLKRHQLKCNKYLKIEWVLFLDVQSRAVRMHFFLFPLEYPIWALEGIRWSVITVVFKLEIP